MKRAEKMAVALCWFFIALAAIGFILSLLANICALFGLPQPLGAATLGLHGGIFVVWLPAVIAAKQLSRDFKQSELWLATLRGCPPWMKRVTHGLLVFAFVNFALFIVLFLAQPPNPNAGFAGGFGLFAGHWMAFYFTSIAILYSFIVVSRHDVARRCPGGHPVTPSAKFCEKCGAEIVDAVSLGDGGEL